MAQLDTSMWDRLMASAPNPMQMYLQAAALRRQKMQDQQDALDFQIRQRHAAEQQRQLDEAAAVRNAGVRAAQGPARTDYFGAPPMNVGGMNLPGERTSVYGPSAVQSPDNFQENFVNELRKGPAAYKIPEYQAQFAEFDMNRRAKLAQMNKDELAAHKTQLDMAAKQLDMASQIAMPVYQAEQQGADPQTLQQVTAQQFDAAVNAGLDPSQVGFSRNYTPGQAARVLGMSADGAKAISDEQKRIDALARDAETRRHNQATEASTKRGQDITLRGQNMVDARSREQNEIKRDEKMTQQYNAETARLDSFNADLDRLATAANEVLTHPGLSRTTGLMGALPNVPGSAASDAAALLQTLKSQVGFNVLQNMRNNSKTGGALGQVSDAENKLLQNNLAALDKAQSTEQIKKSLQKIIDYAQGAKDRARAAVDRQYGGKALKPNNKLPGAPAPAPAGGVRPIYAVNPQTKQRIVSNDGGQTWQVAQ